MVDYATTTGSTDRAAVSQRTNTYAEAAMLLHAQTYQVIGKYALTKTLPKNKSDNITFRRPKPFPSVSGSPLTEGVTPTARKMEYENVTVTLGQYGDVVKITDQVEDLIEDPVMNDAYMLCGEQAAHTKEMVCWGAMIGGTNAFFANGASRSAVNTVLTTGLQRKITRSLKNQLGKKITKMENSTPNWGSEQIDAAYIAICHTDVESDIRSMDGFTPVEKYGTAKAMPYEIGKVEDVRYVASALLNPFIGAGSVTTTGVLNNGTNVNVYPVIYLAKEAFGEVVLKGRGAIEPKVVPVGQLSDSDPLGQRGSVGWKAYFAAVILNQSWLVRAEVAVSDLA